MEMENVFFYPFSIFTPFARFHLVEKFLEWMMFFLSTKPQGV